MNKPKKKKWAAVGIVTLLSIGLGRLLQLATDSMREGIIEKKNLGEILTQIEEANIDSGSLSHVLREHPPLIFIFIATFISVAITVWLYHKILGYLCKSNNHSCQSSEPKKTTEPSQKISDDKKPEPRRDASFSERIQRYTGQELESSLQAIDKERHPDNYRLLCDELEKRKSQPIE